MCDMYGFIYKEMEYKYNGKSEVLLDGRYENYHFIIASIRGSHPCAYIELGEKSSFYGHDYREEIFDDIPVHGGLSYSDNYLHVAKLQGNWIIGWDYAHFEDYIAHPSKYNRIYKDYHKWTVSEILEQDVIPAIKWLKEKDED